MPSKQFLLKPRGYVGERVHCLSGGEPLPYRGKVASNPRLVTADYREYRRVSKSIEGKILRENYSQSFNFSRTIKSTGSPCRGPSIDPGNATSNNLLCNVAKQTIKPFVIEYVPLISQNIICRTIVRANCES